MIHFDAAPPVPVAYPRLSALTSAEIELARAARYIEVKVDPREPVGRTGLDNAIEERANDDVRDWRTRIFIIWFCYLFENFLLIKKPLYALEELILEFKAQDVLDLPDRRLATLYAGAGAAEPTLSSERKRQLELLRPHYARAIDILDNWDALRS